jgi:predicted aldo/keto reductase-like oxidoreductase
MMKKLGFGCMRLPTLGANDKVDIPQFSRMVDEFLGHGFTYFDTSYVYHGGKSEDALQQALVERHPRGSFTITTKLPVFLLKERADTRRFLCGAALAARHRLCGLLLAPRAERGEL